MALATRTAVTVMAMSQLHDRQNLAKAMETGLGKVMAVASARVARGVVMGVARGVTCRRCEARQQSLGMPLRSACASPRSQLASHQVPPARLRRLEVAMVVAKQEVGRWWW